MAEHTPTTETVRDCFVDGAAGDFIEEDFDRWLAAHDAELRAEVERLRREVAAGIETERGSNATARRLLAEARRELADLRAGIEALADTKPGATGRALRTLLAGSGEQPGEVDGYCTCHDDQKGRTRDCGVKDHREAGRPAPVTPDSADVRERVRGAVKRAATWTEDGPEYEEAPDAGMVEEITDAVLAVVGQGVTVEWGVGYGDRHEAASSREDAEEWVADDDAWNPGEERWLVTRQVGPWTRAASRPTGQEGS